MPSTMKCPEAELLEQFFAGDLPDAEVEAIAAHLDVCKICQRYVESTPELAALADDVYSAVRKHTATKVQVGPPLAQLNELLPQYEVLEEIGRGGMGIVYRARQRDLNRIVAIKLLPALYGAMKPEAVTRFRREAELTARLKHNNIIAVHDFGQVQGTCYYTMELVTGRSLQNLLAGIREVGPEALMDTSSVPALSSTTMATSGDEVARMTSGTRLRTKERQSRAYFAKIATWVADVADALEYAHQNGVIHRDIKPSNLLLNADGRLMISDFGLAWADDIGTLTGPRALLGTARYMSPEQADVKFGVIDHRSDIYSLGATLYELLTLRPMFVGANDQQIMSQVVNREPTPPHKLGRRIPAELEIICLKAVEKESKARYQTAKEMADDLRRWLLDLPIHARRTSLPGRMMKFVRRRKVVSALGASLAIALVTSGILLAEYKGTRSEALAAKSASARQQAQLLAIEANRLSDEGQYGEALARVEAGLKLDPKSDELEYSKARLLGELGDDDQYVRGLEAMVARNPELSQPHYALAKHYSEEAQRKQAKNDKTPPTPGECMRIAALHREKFERLAPAGARTLFLRAMIQSETAQALSLLDQALDADPNCIEALMQRFRVHYAAKRYEPALQDAEAVVLLQRGWAEAHAVRAHALMRLGRFTEGEAAYSRAIELEPKAERHWQNRGTSRNELGRFADALADLNEAIRLKPDFALAFTARAKAQAGLGYPGRAMQDCDRAIELDQTLTNAYEGRIILNGARKRWDDIVDDATRIIQLKPNDPSGYQNRAVALHALRKFDREIADITRYIELVPNNPNAYRSRAMARSVLTQHEESLADLERAIELGAQPLDYAGRANIHIALGRYDKTVPDLTRAIELGTRVPIVLLKRGMVYEILGADALAHADYDEAGKADGPTADYARLWKYILLRRSGENETAAKLLTDTLTTAQEGAWTTKLFQIFAGDVEGSRLLADSATDAEKSEAHYYIGMRALLDGRNDEASTAFKACLDLKQIDVLESDFARARLTQLDRLTETTNSHE